MLYQEEATGEVCRRGGMLGCFCVATQSSSTFELDITNFRVQSSNTDQQEDR